VLSCRYSPMTSDPAAAAALLPALSVYGCSSRNACKQVRQAIGRAHYGLEAYEDARVELSQVMPNPRAMLQAGSRRLARRAWLSAV